MDRFILLALVFVVGMIAGGLARDLFRDLNPKD